MMPNKNAQVWIETAIYTLIGLTIIAVLLSIINPQIEKIKANAAIQQTKNSLNELDLIIRDLSSKASGNVKIYHLLISRGKIMLNSSNDSIIYELKDTNLEYSEVDQLIPEGRFLIKTVKYGSTYSIYIILKYEDINITFFGKDADYVFTSNSVPYKISIENAQPQNIGEKPTIDIRQF